MKIFIYILGFLQMAGGVLFAVEAASAIHQILAAVTFGLGSASLGLAVLIDRVERIGRPSSNTSSDGLIDLTGNKGGSWRAQ